MLKVIKNLVFILAQVKRKKYESIRDIDLNSHFNSNIYI